MTRGFLVVCLLCVLAGCSEFDRGRGNADAAALAAFEDLTPALASDVIQAWVQANGTETTLHALEWQMEFGPEAGLWSLRKEQAPNGLTAITVEVLDGARDWVTSAGYFAGGIVPLHLSRPISRRIVSVASIEDAEYPQMKEVRFTWTYSDTPDFLQRLKPQLGGGPYAGRARLQFQEDSWEVVGRVRESVIPL